MTVDDLRKVLTDVPGDYRLYVGCEITERAVLGGLVNKVGRDDPQTVIILIASEFQPASVEPPLSVTETIANFGAMGDMTGEPP